MVDGTASSVKKDFRPPITPFKPSMWGDTFSKFSFDHQVYMIHMQCSNDDLFHWGPIYSNINKNIVYHLKIIKLYKEIKKWKVCIDWIILVFLNEREKEMKYTFEL